MVIIIIIIIIYLQTDLNTCLQTSPTSIIVFFPLKVNGAFYFKGHVECLSSKDQGGSRGLEVARLGIGYHLTDVAT